MEEVWALLVNKTTAQLKKLYGDEVQLYKRGIEKLFHVTKALLRSSKFKKLGRSRTTSITRNWFQTFLLPRMMQSTTTTIGKEYVVKCEYSCLEHLILNFGMLLLCY